MSDTFADVDATATFADHDPYLRDRYREHLAIVSNRLDDAGPPWEADPTTECGACPSDPDAVGAESSPQ